MWIWLIVVLAGLPLAWLARGWMRQARRYRVDARHASAWQAKNTPFFWCYKPVERGGENGRGILGSSRLLARKAAAGR